MKINKRKIVNFLKRNKPTIMTIIGVILTIIVLIVCFSMHAHAKEKPITEYEKYYQEKQCNELGGMVEVEMVNKEAKPYIYTRIDCLAKKGDVFYVIEHDWVNKFHEGIGQAIEYDYYVKNGMFLKPKEVCRNFNLRRDCSKLEYGDLKLKNSIPVLSLIVDTSSKYALDKSYVYLKRAEIINKITNVKLLIINKEY